MSLTAHPYIVLAEQLWKQESLSGANLAPRRPRRPRKARHWHLPRRSGHTVRHTPRPV